MSPTNFLWQSYFKNIEKRIQRQVVLEDGRVIEEDDPEITVDTVEDTENFSDDAEPEATMYYCTTR